jgi:hypothetical protein
MVAVRAMTTEKALVNGSVRGRKMFCLLSIILSVLGGTAFAFGRADYRDLDLGRPIAVESAYPIKLGLLNPQTGIPSYRLEEEGRLDLTTQEGDADLACFPEKNSKPLYPRGIYVVEKLEKGRWLDRYKKSSVCRTTLIQRRGFTKQTFGDVVAASILLIYLVGVVGGAFLVSPKTIEPLKPWIGTAARTD